MRAYAKISNPVYVYFITSPVSPTIFFMIKLVLEGWNDAGLEGRVAVKKEKRVTIIHPPTFIIYSGHIWILTLLKYVQDV